MHSALVEPASDTQKSIVVGGKASSTSTVCIGSFSTPSIRGRGVGCGQQRWWHWWWWQLGLTCCHCRRRCRSASTSCHCGCHRCQPSTSTCCHSVIGGGSIGARCSWGAGPGSPHAFPLTL